MHGLLVTGVRVDGNWAMIGAAETHHTDMAGADLSDRSRYVAAAEV